MTDAMTGLASGKKQNRPQDILTPSIVVDFVRELWGDLVICDPCATRDARDRVCAQLRYYGEHADGFDGLKTAWPDRTYVNPPYKNLRAWMERAVAQSEEITRTGSIRPNRIVMLCPVCGNREWWHACADTADVKVELKNITFVGYTDSKGRPASFPAPVCLLVWGSTLEDVLRALAETGLRATKVTPPRRIAQLLQESYRTAA